MDTNKMFIDMAQRAHEFAEMCNRVANESNAVKEDPEAWRERNRQRQAAGVKFEWRNEGIWRRGYKGSIFTFDIGGEEDYREVPQEDLNLKPTGDRWCEMQIEQPAIGVISSFNKWDRALTEKEISDLFSGKVRPEDIPQEVSAECQNALEHLAKTYSADKGTAQLNPTIPPHAAERALWKAQREVGTNEVWITAFAKNGAACEIPVHIEPGWHDGQVYYVKPMKLTARICMVGKAYPMSYIGQDWEFTGTREEYRAECHKYGYAILSEIKEVVEKHETVKYYFALIRNKFGAVDSLAASSMISFNRIAEKNSYIIIGDIEEREIEA